MFSISQLKKAFNIGFQDSATPIMEGLVDLHNYIFFYLILVLILVLVMLANIFYRYYYLLRWTPFHPFFHDHLVTRIRLQGFRAMEVTHGPRLEMFWTITPSIILMLIAIPSFALLYAMDEVLKPAITFKAIGHQWYWSYEYSDYSYTKITAKNKPEWVNRNISFDSNLVFESELQKGEYRLLQVDNPIVLPTNTHVRVLITSMDVLHSWAVPSLGVKLDAVPGRLNQAFIYLKREGVFYGQCSELCGVNHGFMPIVVKGVSLNEYLAWISKGLQAN